MQAAVGDTIVVEGQHIGRQRRTGEIREVRGRQGEPPYIVHWRGDSSDSLVYPGSDAHIERGLTDTRPL
jgi:Domain of unknown function (DUF1918)